jgi:hypothetical protein
MTIGLVFVPGTRQQIDIDWLLAKNKKAGAFVWHDNHFTYVLVAFTEDVCKNIHHGKQKIGDYGRLTPLEQSMCTSKD